MAKLIRVCLFEDFVLEGRENKNMFRFRGKGELSVHQNCIKRVDLLEALHSQTPSVTSKCLCPR